MFILAFYAPWSYNLDFYSFYKKSICWLAIGVARLQTLIEWAIACSCSYGVLGAWGGSHTCGALNLANLWYTFLWMCLYYFNAVMVIACMVLSWVSFKLLVLKILVNTMIMLEKRLYLQLCIIIILKLVSVQFKLSVILWNNYDNGPELCFCVAYTYSELCYTNIGSSSWYMYLDHCRYWSCFIIQCPGVTQCSIILQVWEYLTKCSGTLSMVKGIQNVPKILVRGKLWAQDVFYFFQVFNMFNWVNVQTKYTACSLSIYIFIKSAFLASIFYKKSQNCMSLCCSCYK